MSKPLIALAALGLAATVSAGDGAGASPGSASSRPRQRVLKTWDDTVKLDGREVWRHVEIVFDYVEGVARELSYDASRRLIHTRELAAPPRPSAEEMAEAEQILRSDPALSRIMQRTGARPHGMFPLHQEEGQPCGPRTRCLQVLVVSKDGFGLLRRVVVDLTKMAVVSRSYVPEETGQ